MESDKEVIPNWETSQTKPNNIDGFSLGHNDVDDAS